MAVTELGFHNRWISTGRTGLEQTAPTFGSLTFTQTPLSFVTRRSCALSWWYFLRRCTNLTVSCETALECSVLLLIIMQCAGYITRRPPVRRWSASWKHTLQLLASSLPTYLSYCLITTIQISSVLFFLFVHIFVPVADFRKYSSVHSGFVGGGKFLV